MKQPLLIRFGIRGLTFLLLLMLIQPVFAAARPYMNIVANWTPSQTLDTNGADERFVELQMLVQGNVQFWAAEISCTVGRGTELEFISLQAPANVWGTSGTDMTLVPLPDTTNGDIFSYTAATDVFNADARGTLSFTLSRLGFTTSPLGVNGADYSLNLANVRFKVMELASNTNVAVTCRVANFLDRDGNLVQRGRQTRTSALTILTGYTLSGSVSRQGSRIPSNVEVTCTNDPDGTPTVFGPIPTDRAGNFSFDEDGELRTLGLYECDVESKLDGITPDQPYLISQLRFLLRTPQLSLLPVVMRTGDINGDDVINFGGDVFSLAAVYDTVVVNPFDTGDVNGDRRVDDTDLSLTAANVGLTGPITVDHILYGLGRDFSSDVIFPNSQLWWGFAEEGNSYPLIARSRTRDFWPMISPDGSTIAYTAATDRRGVTSYDLYYLDVDRGRAAPARLPRTFTDEALAPSWSPDGSMVAFICTPRGEVGDPNFEGYLYNNGDICIINSDDVRGD
ncbi:MAG: PD40 domain-containing protein, partial [Anaerolineae bacterium]|nr:PD40 domain-containing protein [Anaerolineae bacterium]